MIRTVGLAALAATLVAGAAAAQGGGPFSAANVTPEAPFGTIDVSAAGGDAAAVLAFLQGRTGAEVVELIQRCHVIAPPDMSEASAGAYGTAAADFCGFLTAAIFAPPAVEVAGDAPAANVVGYTAAQADRGEGWYMAECAMCHGESLAGSGEAPGVVGAGFRAAWMTLPAVGLYSFIHYAMPQQAPNSLSSQAYADIVAFLMEANGFTPGDTEFPTDEAALGEMMFPPSP